MKIFLISLLVFSFVGSALGRDKIDRMNAVTPGSFTPDIVKWNDEPILPNGAQSAVLVGDPNRAGVFIAWLKFPPNYPIPPHKHPFTEVITVLRGKLFHF
ncbi:cupin domain-containing protein [Methylocaldum szegediense]|uniref:Cupin type-1 domain-containing protein n=1 Tax=Methylocaldum szegediense TaxID=73780 RepID=A0ABM9HYY8_9GAMM|nr:cupin domain-containing protein [Methylocaldum szegediense]CAI8778507.1 protein of unknown function [Methylocaldum szegediense]